MDLGEVMVGVMVAVNVWSRFCEILIEIVVLKCVYYGEKWKKYCRYLYLPFSVPLPVLVPIIWFYSPREGTRGRIQDTGVI